ncbi:hypothetical protein [Denitromonas halophila]|uniref:DnrO protein n=1 Tax=Denitromonas halophila TaxID=1629404 RepID=A0A557R026_9RHOO|nr:hypothetical protein [Denitromonas halophila]TVO58515.1 hypothetical protein FHP91_02270 [Denitromonas halophila]
MTTRTLTHLACVLSALAAFTMGGAVAASGEHHHDASPPALTLNAGSKWQTDAPLREGMQHIRARLELTLPAVHAGQASAAQYGALVEAVEQEVAGIVAHCKLPPDADAVLHGVIAELSQAADALRAAPAETDQRAGVIRLVTALDAYGRHFDHPGWAPVATGH